MTEHDENWAKAQNPDVESAKDALAYSDALEAAELRNRITQYATGAVKHSVDRDWANTRLAALGAKPVTGTAEYRMNIPVIGMYGWRCKASNRAEALERFMQQVARLTETGKITADGSYDNVYDLHFSGSADFYSGPEDPAEVTDPGMTLAELKDAIRAMLKDGVAQQGWGIRYAAEAVRNMALEPLPNMTSRVVEVAVSGTAKVTVKGFEGDDDDAVQASASAMLNRMSLISVSPEEINSVKVETPDEDDDQDDDDGPF